MITNHPKDLLPAYALGCLDSEEQDQVAKHLLNCAACRAELYELEEVSAHLAYAVPAVDPPKAVKKSLLANCHSRRSFSWFEALFSRWPRLVPVTAMASFILVMLFGTSTLLLWKGAETKMSGAMADLQLVPLYGTETMPRALGQLVVDQSSGEGRLLVSALPPLTSTQQYQLWLIHDGERASGAVFSVAQKGTTEVLISAAQPFAYFDSVGITIEPYGGSPEPTGQKVLGGQITL